MPQARPCFEVTQSTQRFRECAPRNDLVDFGVQSALDTAGRPVEVNEVLHDIGASTGALTAVALELAGMLDEVAGRRWIENELAAELGYFTH